MLQGCRPIEYTENGVPSLFALTAEELENIYDIFLQEENMEKMELFHLLKSHVLLDECKEISDLDSKNVGGIIIKLFVRYDNKKKKFSKFYEDGIRRFAPQQYIFSLKALENFLKN